MKALNIIIDKLKTLKNKKEFRDIEYSIPDLWLIKNSNSKSEVNPFDFFISSIEGILKDSNKPLIQVDEDISIYNMFVRLTTAFDHNNNGKIEIPSDEKSFKETGTFLKSIAILPYLKSLGINTIYLLPITSIGIDEKKGNLGSPYAIRNPYKIDENLAETILDIDVDTQFKAFTEAAHLLGFKVILEFVFRTASVDSDLAIDHPDWFYWIKAKVNNRVDKKNDKQYGPPIFNLKEIEKIKSKVEQNDFKNLPVPNENHLNMFTPIPKKVARVENKIRGLLDGKNEVKIPGAFADWPPNDTQPVWSDVTYLKLFNHPKFNYIAYNTIRMYDSELIKEENKNVDLWEFITGIIPHYQNEFGIDGVMIDMGHALPSELRSEIVKKAKSINPDFIFWEENFTLNQKSVEDGYHAVLGYLPFDAHIHSKMKSLISMIQKGECPIDFFATSESHNTPRAASRYNDVEFSKLTYTFNKFLPTLSFIHNGFELGEKKPVNTGLDFHLEDYLRFPADKLPLFSIASLSWLSDKQFTDYIRKINNIRNLLINDRNELNGKQIVLLNTSVDNVVAFLRRDFSTKTEVLVCGNYNPKEVVNCEIETNYGTVQFDDEITGIKYLIHDGKLGLSLKPFECKVGTLRIEL